MCVQKDQNDLDATDGIENQGNSLTKPFKTIQRALIESARFSYLRGNDNDLVERTTILLFPGEHIVDNRPGYGIKNESGVAKAVTPAGDSSAGAINTFTLTLNSNFDLTQEDNILYKFNSVHGGVVVPRGTSIVGLDLRKTKIRKACLGKNTTIVYRYFYFKSSSINKFLTVREGVEPSSPARNIS